MVTVVTVSQRKTRRSIFKKLRTVQVQHCWWSLYCRWNDEQHYPMPFYSSLHSPSYHPVNSRCGDDSQDAGVNRSYSCSDAPGPLDESELNHSIPPDNSDVSSESCTISIDDAIERLGFGRFQLQILMATGLSYAADGIQVILLSFLTPTLKDLWNLTDHEAAGISSTLFVGATFGTLIWGPLADVRGRRRVFLMATTVIAIASMGISLVPPDVRYILIMVFGIGFGVGGLTIPFDILAEFLPTQNRGAQLLRINYAWTLGVLYVVVGAYLFLQNSTESPFWRQFTTWCSCPCLLSLLIGYCVIPESPRWLTSKGRLDEAMSILRRAAATNGYDPNLLFPSEMKLEKEVEERQAKIYELLQPQWRRTTLCLWGAWLTFSFGYFGTLMVTTRIFSSSPDKSGNSAKTKFDFDAIFISSIAEFIGTTLAIMIIDRVGRIRSQVASFLVAGVLLCFFCSLAEWQAKRWILLLFAFMARIFEMTATCILWVSTAEILTTEIRGAGHSSSNAFARIGAIFCPLLVQNNKSFLQVGVTMLLFHVVTAYCVSKLPETKDRNMGLGYTSPTQQNRLDIH